MAASGGDHVGQLSSRGCEPKAPKGRGAQRPHGRPGERLAALLEVGGRQMPDSPSLPLPTARSPAPGSAGPQAGRMRWSPTGHIWGLVVAVCSLRNAAAPRADSESDRPGFCSGCFSVLHPQLTLAEMIALLGASLASRAPRGRAPVACCVVRRGLDTV